MTPRPLVVSLARGAIKRCRFGPCWFVWIPSSAFKRRWVIASYNAPRWC